MPTTLVECAALEEWAQTSVSPIALVTPEELLVHLTRLNAVLPSRNADVETGKARMTVYGGVLAPYSNDALTAMVREAVATLDWFPTPKQCLEILSRYRAPATEQEMALVECRTFSQAAFNEWYTALTQHGVLGEAPDQWHRIAVERGVMRLLNDGSFVVRALYHGPFLPRGVDKPQASVKLRIPNKDDYQRIFGIDPEVEAAKAQAEREQDEETGRDMLLATVQDHVAKWSDIPVKPKYQFSDAQPSF